MSSLLRRYAINPLPEATPRYMETLLTGALLTLAINLTVASLPGRSQEAPTATSPLATSTLTATAQPSPLPDGVYLYGQSAKANQIGSAYLVLKVNQRQVVGVFYMPASSFDCFQGQVETAKLDLTVVESYEQKSYPYSIALNQTARVAANQPQAAIAELVGYHRLPTISSNDRRMLATCEADQQKSLLVQK
jgi:hypothetical protein